MKRAVVVLGLISVWAGYTRAQTSSTIESQSVEISATLIAPDDPQSPGGDLPDAPIPVLSSRRDAPMPCPAGDGKPCALLGGRVYFRDLSHMTEHDKTWVHALKNPLMLGGIAANLAAAVWEYRATRACFDSHRCTAASPLMRSQAGQIAVNFGSTAAISLFAAELKHVGDGNTAFAVLIGNALGHVYHALQVQSLGR